MNKKDLGLLLLIVAVGILPVIHLTRFSEIAPAPATSSSGAAATAS